MSHLEKNRLSNKDYKMVIPELFKDIKVYHLKFIEQLEIEKFPEYVYNKDIKNLNQGDEIGSPGITAYFFLWT